MLIYLARRFVYVLVLLLNSTLLLAGDLADGISAYDTHQYEKAFQILKPLAEKGNPEAQRKLGVMFRHGLARSTRSA